MAEQQETLSEILAKWLPIKDSDAIWDGTDAKALKNEGAVCTMAEIVQIKRYIEAPTSEGYWRLTGTWKYDGAFIQYVYQANQKTRYPSQVRSNKRNTTRAAVVHESEFVEKIASRLSPLLEVFTYARKLETTPGEQPSPRDPGIQHYFSDIDWADFRAVFKDANDIFVNEIYFDGFSPTFFIHGFARLAQGSVCALVGPADDSTVKFAASDQRSLHVLGRFLEAAGQLESPIVDRVFSPEEDLFDPYFTFLSSVFSSVLPDHRLQQQIGRAFEQFENKDYLHCVSSLGLIAEDHLIQVFESYLREACPRGQTLGQVFDVLHSRVKDLVSPPKEKLKNLDSIYEQIKALTINEELSEDKGANEKLEGVLRQIVSTIVSDRHYFTQRVEDLSKKDPRVSVFPKALYLNIDELIRHRNAASHKTRVPVGRYEALRSLYCLMTLILWWRAEKQQIVWSDEKMQIIKSAIQRASHPKN
ncbi:MAG: hypothetical protein V4528_02680 [Pseudomonadota bacterium]